MLHHDTHTNITKGLFQTLQTTVIFTHYSTSLIGFKFNFNLNVFCFYHFQHYSFRENTLTIFAAYSAHLNTVQTSKFNTIFLPCLSQCFKTPLWINFDNHWQSTPESNQFSSILETCLTTLSCFMSTHHHVQQMWKLFIDAAVLFLALTLICVNGSKHGHAQCGGNMNGKPYQCQWLTKIDHISKM